MKNCKGKHKTYTLCYGKWTPYNQHNILHGEYLNKVEIRQNLSLRRFVLGDDTCVHY